MGGKNWVESESKYSNPFCYSRELNQDFQHILTNPILDIGARFWEDERYDAFRICYRTLRVIDDLIDNRKISGQEISGVEIQQLTTKVNEWVKSIEEAKPHDFSQKQLLETIARFRIPLWPWQSFSKSMIYDIHNDGFRILQDFIRYAEGAAVAPGCIYVHLCGVVKENGEYRPPIYDIIGVTRPFALFSYLVHIIRDFQEDQYNNLNYFAEDLMAENGVNRSMLEKIAAGGEVNTGFRKLMERYYNLAEHYRRETRQVLDRTTAYLEPRYQLSLEVIYSLYLQIFERINIPNGKFTTAELNPSPEEVRNRINQTIASLE